jgi:imidazoleglycerol phosphate synthase glutamine amidotransferase subunit HisH
MASRRIRAMHVVAIDYGVKRNILRLLAGLGAKVTVVPAKTSAEDILAMKPDGIFLSNGPSDPEATGEYAVPMIQDLLKTEIPMFGICLGHQMLALAARRQDPEDAPGPSRRQPSREGPHHRQGGNRLDEPRLRGRLEDAAERR